LCLKEFLVVVNYFVEGRSWKRRMLEYACSSVFFCMLINMDILCA
jgi:hypothetical protein